MSAQESHSVLPASGRYARFNRPSSNLVGGTQPHPDDIRKPQPAAEPESDVGQHYTGRYARFNRPSTNLVGGTQPYVDDVRRHRQAAEAADDPEFFTLRQQSADSGTFTIPKAPDRPAKTHWLRHGEAITVAGIVLPDGLIYAGKKDVRFGLKEPSFIDISLRVDGSPGEPQLQYLSYWTPYNQLTPRARFDYLQWLADGRCAPEIDIAHVLRFFFGLERRAALEAATNEQAREDITAIKAEMQRLVGLYGENASFRSHALRFLDYLSFPGVSAQMYLQDPPAALAENPQMSVHTRIALGQMAADKYPLNTDWALTWALSDHYISRRTPVSRCLDLFQQLFRQGFARRFPRGLKLLNNKTRLRITYQSASLYLLTPDLPVGDLPDISVTTGARNKLQLVADECCLVLDPFSRYLARNPDKPDALEGLLLLPTALWPQQARHTLEDLQAGVGHDAVLMTLGELTARFKSTATLPRDKAVALARVLETLNIGLEPDVLAGSRTPKAQDIIALFNAEPEDATVRSTAHYQAAVVTLDLASLVITADGNGSQDEAVLSASQIDSWSHLSAAQRRRLKAHLQIQVQQPPTLASLKKKLEPLTPDQKRIIARFLAHLAQADGTVTTAEVKLLERIYKALQLDPQSLYSELHSAAAGLPGSAAHHPARGASTGPTAKAPGAGIVLDMARVAQLQRETAEVSALLATVFQDEHVDSPVAVTVVEHPAVDTGSTLYGLDIEHSALLRLLVSRTEWSRHALQEAAADLDLMLDGALEQINDMAFELFDMPISEGDDPIEINPDILSELTL